MRTSESAVPGLDQPKLLLRDAFELPGVLPHLLGPDALAAGAPADAHKQAQHEVGAPLAVQHLRATGRRALTLLISPSGGPETRT